MSLARARARARARYRARARALHRCISTVIGIQNFHPILFECIDEALCRINFNLSARKVIFRTEKSSQEKNISVKFFPPQVTYVVGKVGEHIFTGENLSITVFCIIFLSPCDCVGVCFLWISFIL